MTSRNNNNRPSSAKANVPVLYETSNAKSPAFISPAQVGQIVAAHAALEDRYPGVTNALLSRAGKAGRNAISYLRNSDGVKWPKMPSSGGNSKPGKPKGESSSRPTNVFAAPASSGDSYALSPAPKPRDFILNSRIEPNAYANDYMAPTLLCSPMHTSIVSLSIPTSVDNPMSKYFTDTICFDIQTRAQSGVSFSLDITTLLSSANLVGMFNSVIKALQIYYYYSSILSYESDSRNKNSGMIALRKTITPTILSDLSQLGKRLEDCTAPKALVEWVKYMNGNFSSGPSQGSPLLKFVLDGPMLDGTSAFTPALALSELTAYTNQFSLIRKCIPSWRIGVLKDCHPTPTYDPNFITIFGNMPGLTKPAATYINSYNVTDLNQAIPYNSFKNRLDGLAYAMGSVCITVASISSYVPGLCQPRGTNGTYTDSRFSYWLVSGNPVWAPVSSYSFLAHSRNETAKFITGAASYIYPHLSGAEMCQGVTGNSLLQSAQETLDFLFETRKGVKRGKIADFNAPSRQMNRRFIP